MCCKCIILPGLPFSGNLMESETVSFFGFVYYRIPLWQKGMILTLEENIFGSILSSCSFEVFRNNNRNIWFSSKIKIENCTRIMLKRIVFISLCALTIFLMLVSQGYSLRCFQCNSYINKSCESIDEKEDKIYLQPCEKDHIICRTEYHTIRGEYRVIRSCGKTKHRKPCYLGASQDIKSQTCECDKDGCNTAVKTEPNIFKLISIVLLSLYLLR